jgi:hypothetical protein
LLVVLFSSSEKNSVKSDWTLRKRKDEDKIMHDYVEAMRLVPIELHLFEKSYDVCAFFIIKIIHHAHQQVT